MDEKRAYEIAGQILEGHCIEGIPAHKGQQIADKIVAVLTGRNKKTENDIALLCDLLFIYYRLNWNNEEGRRLAQNRIDEIHGGKYGDRQGCYVQFVNAIERLKARDKSYEILKESVVTVLNWAEFEIHCCSKCGQGDPVKESDYIYELKDAIGKINGIESELMKQTNLE